MTRLEEALRGVASLARQSWRDGLVVHLLALFFILVLLGAWGLVWLLWQHLARFLGVVSLSLALGHAAGCAALSPPPPCVCTCNMPPPNLPPPVVRDVEGDFRDELDRRQAGREQRDKARKALLGDAAQAKTKAVRP